MPISTNVPGSGTAVVGGIGVGTHEIDPSGQLGSAATTGELNVKSNANMYRIFIVLPLADIIY